MYYEIYGEGNMPLVLIHGGGSTIETSFSRMLPLFSAHTQVIAVELQAHGRTNDRDAPESFDQDADDVAALLKYLKIDKADILGFSNGGSTAMKIAIRHPGLVNKIVVVAGISKREGMIHGFFEGMQAPTLDSMPRPLKDAFLKVTPDQDRLQQMFERDVARMQTFTDWPDEELRSIKAPALLMVADRDVVTIEHTLDMSRLIPDARLVVLPGVHGSFIGEICAAEPGSKMPEMTAVLVEEFLGFNGNPKG
jgi:pimeloyl-ACP methyl ester carboxylesterase